MASNSASGYSDMFDLQREILQGSEEDNAKDQERALMSDWKQQVKDHERRKDRLARIDRRGTRKGFMVLVGLMAIAAWFLYYHVLGENKKMFFVILLVMFIAVGYAFFMMVLDGGAQVANKFY